MALDMLAAAAEAAATETETETSSLKTPERSSTFILEASKRRQGTLAHTHVNTEKYAHTRGASWKTEDEKGNKEEKTLMAPRVHRPVTTMLKSKSTGALVNMGLTTCNRKRMRSKILCDADIDRVQQAIVLEYSEAAPRSNSRQLWTHPIPPPLPLTSDSNASSTQASPLHVAGRRSHDWTRAMANPPRPATASPAKMMAIPLAPFTSPSSPKHATKKSLSVADPDQSEFLSAWLELSEEARLTALNTLMFSTLSTGQ